MENNIILQNVSPEKLTELIKNGVKSQLEEFKKEFNDKTAKDDLMTREQVLELLQINPTTLWHYQNKGKVIVYKLCNKNYYKCSEILHALKPVKK
jgi:hypothetical protein